MCIIAVKKSGIELASKSILENCEQTNRDGIGIAYNRPGDKTCHISKGFANVKELLAEIETLKLSKHHNIIYHFRYATHGLKDAGNCHPFPLTANLEAMRSTKATCKTAIAHNGVFGNMTSSDKYSDTMKFVSGVLAMPDISENLDKRPIQELIRGYCGTSSKLAFLGRQGITTIGEWKKHKGILYSNSGFQRVTYTYQSSGIGYDFGKAGKHLAYSEDICDYCGRCEDVTYSKEFDGHTCSRCRAELADYNADCEMYNKISDQ